METLPEIQPVITELEQARIKLLNLSKHRNSAKEIYHAAKADHAAQVLAVRILTEKEGIAG